METDNRLDYFRSELRREIHLLGDQAMALESRLSKRIADLEQRCDALTRELAHLKLSR